MRFRPVWPGLVAALVALGCDSSTPSPAPVRLGFSVQPGNTTAGTTMSVAVEVQDASGEQVPSATSPITLTLALGPNIGASLSGTTTVAAVGGVATFSDLHIEKAGVGYKLTASALNLSGASSFPFDVMAGPPARLAFGSQPVLTPTEAAISPAVQVMVFDAGGNLVPGVPITLALGTNPGNGTLSGSTTVATVGGVATFADLSIDAPGVGYTLVASAAALPSTVSVPFTIRASFMFASISAGYFHTCGVAIGGDAYCWGENYGGQLGDGSTTSTLTPASVVGGISFASISAGRDHSCGLTAAGEAYCWGSDGSGQLGNGTSANRSAPRPVAGGLTFAAVTAGYSHTCGVTPTGVAYCWGSNDAGELGDGTKWGTNIPTAITGGLTFSMVNPGRDFTCGVTMSNAAYCWGAAALLGNGTNVSSSSPVPVAGGVSLATVGAGGFHACGLTTDGAGYCWGDNSFGQLGLGIQSLLINVPAPVVGGPALAQLSVGNRHTCGVTAGGAAFCWGDNSDGKLGDGTTITRSVPTPVSGGLTFASVSAGRFHTCGVTPSNLAYCWGANGSGQLGIGASTSNPVPVRVR